MADIEEATVKDQDELLEITGNLARQIAEHEQNIQALCKLIARVMDDIDTLAKDLSSLARTKQKGKSK